MASRSSSAFGIEGPSEIEQSSKLLTKSAPRLGRILVACGLVTSAIGCTRPRHGLPDSINRLSRYFAHPFLNGFQRTRCRLRARSGHGFRSSRWPGGSFCFEHGIDLCLHGGEVVPTWAGVTRRNRGGEHSCGRYYRSHSHNSASTSARFTLSKSLDHLVGAGEQRRWNFQAKRPGGRKIDDELELDRLHDRQVGRLGTLENATRIIAELPIHLRQARSVAHQAADLRVLAHIINGWKRMARRQRGELDLPAVEERVG